MDINNITLVILIAISILGIILSAWSVDTFRKLKEKSNDANFETNCKVQKDSVTSGLTFSAILLTVSLIVFIFCGYTIFKKSGYKITN